jgi:hypothetical protein
VNQQFDTINIGTKLSDTYPDQQMMDQSMKTASIERKLFVARA